MSLTYLGLGDHNCHDPPALEVSYISGDSYVPQLLGLSILAARTQSWQLLGLRMPSVAGLPAQTGHGTLLG